MYVRFLLLLSGVGIAFTATSQLCTGSLGDPVVNITFAYGTSYSGYVPASSYAFNYTNCPNDGYYTVTDRTADCFGNTWHTVTEDHTGNGGFMIVNASYNPGDFFVTTVNNLCPNTTYEFAAWILNVMKPFNSIRPNITFNIETPAGVVLKTFNSGNIDVTSAPQWKQHGFFFTTPATNAMIVLRMTNNAPGGIGNDVALDDITFRPCGSKITASILGSNSDTVDVCTGNTNVYQFNATVSSNYQLPLYQWQVSSDKGISWTDIAGAKSISYTRQPTTEGNFWYRMSVIEISLASISSCRIASNPVIINVHPKPVIDAGPDRIMVAGKPITLNARAEGEQVTHLWSPGSYMDDTQQLSPIVSPTIDIDYTLDGQSVYGCTNHDAVKVKVVKAVFIPNAFTPNGDGKNDAWQIPFLDPSFDADVKVFNRWGKMVYQATSSKVSWDGSFNGVPQETGVYVYLVTFKTRYLENRKGTIMLIR